MTDVVEKLADRVSVVEKDNAILSKEFELFGGWFKESITSLKETTEEIKDGNNLLRESLNAQKLEMEYKFKELELKQENREQVKENEVLKEKLTTKEKVVKWWNEPSNLGYKLTFGLGTVIILVLASKAGVLEPIMQILTK